MKYPLLTLFAVVCLFQTAFSQVFYNLEATSKTELFDFGQWNAKTKTAVVFADVCNVRTAPDAKAEVAGKLSIGTPVQILEVSGSKHEQSGINAPWVKIKTAALTGYVWGGLLSNGSAKLADGKQLLWGLISITPGGGGWQEYKVSVRLASNGAVLEKHDFALEYAGRPSEGELSVYAPPKLAGVQNMMIFSTPSEACGVTATQHYFLYAGGHLVFVGSGHSMGDGGMMHTVLEYVFPYPQPEDQLFSDYHYTPNPEHIIRIENQGSYDDNCDWVETHKVRNFKWEAGKYTKFCEY